LRTLRVGPESAGADPGPACYGKGNTVPTVTDADVVLGYLDPDNFLGGRMRLDKAKSVAAVQAVADQLGMGLLPTAAGIAKIAEFKMADIIRKTTVEKGYDPRDFTVFAFGGAGPVHAGVFARELEVKQVVVPLNRVASTWCAFGAATADVLHIHEQVDILSSPFDGARMQALWAELAQRAAQQMDHDGIAKSGRSYMFSVDMRHRGQINEVEVALGAGTARGPRVSAALLRQLQQDFYTRYEALYGKGSSYAAAKLEAVTFRVRATAPTQRLTLPKARLTRAAPPAAALRGRRDVYWSDLGKTQRSAVYDGAKLRPGHQVKGPCIVETTETTIVVHPGQRLRVDAWGNFELLFNRSAQA